MAFDESFLYNDIPCYCGVINCMKRGTAQIIAHGEQSIYLRDTLSGVFFLAAACETEAARLLAYRPLAPGEECEALTRAAAETLKTNYPRAKMTECRQYVYLGSDPPAYEKRLDISPAQPGDLPFVKRHYRLVSGEMLALAVERGELFLAREDNEKVGFIGVHAEGCMGMLFVLPRFRRRGYGREMELFLTGEVMKSGMYPYGQVFVTNRASLALQKSTVYGGAECEMFWFLV